MGDRRGPLVAGIVDAVVHRGHRHRLGRIPVARRAAGEAQRSAHPGHAGRVARRRHRHCGPRPRVRVQHHRVGSLVFPAGCGRVVGLVQRHGRHRHRHPRRRLNAKHLFRGCRLIRVRGGRTFPGVTVHLGARDRHPRRHLHVMDGVRRQARDPIRRGVDGRGVVALGEAVSVAAGLPLHPEPGLAADRRPRHVQRRRRSRHRRHRHRPHRVEGLAHPHGRVAVGALAADGCQRGHLHVMGGVRRQARNPVRRGVGGGGVGVRRHAVGAVRGPLPLHLVPDVAGDVGPRHVQRRCGSRHRRHRHCPHLVERGARPRRRVAVHRASADLDQRGHQHVVSLSRRQARDPMRRRIGGSGVRIRRRAVVGVAAGLPLHPVARVAVDVGP